VEINTQANTVERSNESLDVIILRIRRVIDAVFEYSLVVCLWILNINFGAALSLVVVKNILKRPIGPGICAVLQFLFMPLTAYGLGLLFFPDDHDLALGLFFCGIAPGGGTSNIYALLLGGNINLSVTMTTISNFVTLGTIPLWVFTLGKRIFDRAELRVPYVRISILAFGLLIPLGIGLLIQRYMPRVTKFLIRTIRPASLVIVVYIAVLGIVTNLYMSSLFTWRVNYSFISPHNCSINKLFSSGYHS